MLEFAASNRVLVVSILVFVAVLMLLEGLYLLWKAHRGPQARKLEHRLRALTARPGAAASIPLLKRSKLSAVPAFERALENLPRSTGVQQLIRQAGLQWTVSSLLLGSAVLAALSYALLDGWAHQPTGVALGAAVLCGSLPTLYVARRRKQRLAQIEQQLPEAIDLIIRALRAGHAFASGLQMVGDEMNDPIAGEFRIMHDEITYGVPLQQALMNLSERVPLTDLRYFVVAVLIQRESGGNLTEVLGNLSRLIRERLKLRVKIRVLSSEGRLSAWVLGVMPFALAGAMNLVNPEFMSRLWTDPIGIAILEYLAFLMLVGVLLLRKIIHIRV